MLTKQLVQNVMTLPEGYHMSVAHEETDKCVLFHVNWTKVGICSLDASLFCVHQFLLHCSGH
jgi:hypothetical protein